MFMLRTQCAFALLAIVALTAAAGDGRDGAAEAAVQGKALVQAVNPLTARSLALEQKQIELEEARLDEQIAAAQFNRRKYLSEAARLADTPPSATAVGPLLRDAPRMPGPLLPHSVASVEDIPLLPGGSPPAVVSPRTQGPEPRRRSSDVRAKVHASAHVRGRPDKAWTRAGTLRLVGISASGTHRHALIESDAGLVRVAAGDTISGRKVETVDERRVVLSGLTLDFEDHLPRVGSGRPEVPGTERPAAPRAEPLPGARFALPLREMPVPVEASDAAPR